MIKLVLTIPASKAWEIDKQAQRRAENRGYTVILTVAVDGKKEHPWVIFKGNVKY